MVQEAEIVGASPSLNVRSQMHFGEDAGYLFKLNVLRRDPELLSAVLSLFQAHNELEEEGKAAHVAELEARVDTLIEKARSVRAEVSVIENEQLEVARKLASAEATLTNCRSSYDQQLWAIRNNTGLYTRAEQAERDSQLAKAKELLEKAALAESHATTNMRNANERLNTAVNVLKAADIAAKECRAELDALQGRTGGYRPSGFQVA